MCSYSSVVYPTHPGEFHHLSGRTCRSRQGRIQPADEKLEKYREQKLELQKRQVEAQEREQALNQERLEQSKETNRISRQRSKEDMHIMEYVQDSSVE